LDVDEWFQKNSFRSKSFSDVKKLVQLKRKQKKTISVVIPTLNEEKTIASIVSILKKSLMDKRKLVDEIIVIDSGSTDKTKEEAEKAGAAFVYSKDVLKRQGFYKGKGENMWKSLYAAKGDIIVWIDGDIRNFHTRFVYGLVGPLLTQKNIGFTKAFYQRPIKVGKELRPLGGGRVTEILIRPLFNMYFPRLSGFIQPLSGEYAIKREIAERMSFFTGYSIETALLIDIEKKFGLRVMAQVDLVKRIHRNQSLLSLSNMAFGILQVFAKRANTLGKLIQVQKPKKVYRTIESAKENSRIIYSLKKKPIPEVQRDPIITVNQYRKKFKKNPEWRYV